MPAANQNLPTFKNLDIMRFLAALYVLCYHTYTYFIDNYKHPPLFADSQTITNILSIIDTFIKNGPLGVDLFFLISGFLITSLLLSEKSTNGQIGIKRFYIRRALRIWPLYYFIIVFAYLFAHYFTGEEMHRKDIYPHLLFVGNFAMIKANAWCAGKLFILWSLCIEEQFYVIIPIVLAFVPTRKIPYLLGFFIIASVVTRFILTQTYQYPWFAIYLHTGSRFDVLAIGCLLGYMNYAGYRVNLTTIVRVVLLAWFIVSLCTLNVLNFDGWFRALFGKYIYILPLSVLFLDAVQNKLPGLKHTFWRGINVLGKYTYGMYMFQVFMIVVADRITSNYFYKNSMVFIVLSIVLTIVVSVLSYELMEKRLIQLKTAFE